MLIVILISFLSIFALISYLIIKSIKNKVSKIEMIILIGYLFTLFLFGIGLLVHSYDYDQAIDPVDGDCYTPLGRQHIMTLIVYFVAFHTALILIWQKGRAVPPLTLAVALCFIFIGFIINTVVLIQILGHHTQTIDPYHTADNFYFIFSPIFSIILSILLLIKVFKKEHSLSQTRHYDNKTLNYLNSIVASKWTSSIWGILLLLPIFLIISIILMLFGQNSDSIVKVFTETTTWTFSQKMHPPILDHTGHYLCTIAAQGDPKIVKPIRLGTRNCRTIIVNRQLLIANAFEEMIYELSPKIHHFIRKNYDKYGFNISQMIASKNGSNITYLLMKPLEYIFLVALYIGNIAPEKKINEQYKEI